MAKYVAGPTMIIQFWNANGTATIQNQYQVFDTKLSSDTVDVSSGSTTAHQRLATLKDSSFSYEGFSNGKSSPLGTADLHILVHGAYGTLQWAPLGTASGNPKGQVACIVNNKEISYPYADAVKVKLDWESDGDLIADPDVATF